MRWLRVTGLILGLCGVLAADALAGTRTITVTGKVDDPTAIVKVNSATATVDALGVFSGSVTLQEGANTITITATDAVGNVGQASVKVSLDTVPPVVTITSPKDGRVFGAN